MELTIITPSSQSTVHVLWIEVQTMVGNRVIQSDHAPMLMLLKPTSQIILCVKQDEQETMQVIAGTLRIERNKATLLLHEE